MARGRGADASIWANMVAIAENVLTFINVFVVVLGIWVWIFFWRDEDEHQIATSADEDTAL